jgi:hypothetical protein
MASPRQLKNKILEKHHIKNFEFIINQRQNTNNSRKSYIDFARNFKGENIWRCYEGDVKVEVG